VEQEGFSFHRETLRRLASHRRDRLAPQTTPTRPSPTSPSFRPRG
jgi:hypothetical protein